MRPQPRSWEDYCWDHGRVYAIEEGCEECGDDRRRRQAAEEAREAEYWAAYEEAYRPDPEPEPEPEEDQHSQGGLSMAQAAEQQAEVLTYICGREVQDRCECLAVVHALSQTKRWAAEGGVLVYHTTAGRTIVERDPFGRGVWFSHYAPRAGGSIKFLLPEKDVREWLLLGRRDPERRGDLMVLLSTEP